MGDQAKEWTALGATGESVMALYAITRLLKSRDLGPAQLVPAVEANRADALKLAPLLRELFGLLQEASNESPHLRAALAELEPFATEVADGVAEAFTRRGLSRLGARERLRLERRAEQLGSDLEGIRAQLELVAATLHARPVELLLANVVGGRSGQAPTFVSRQASIAVDLRDEKGFVGDPRVLWLLFEAALRQLAPQGDHFVLEAQSDDHGGVCVRIRAASDRSDRPGSNGLLRLDLGAPIRVERKVVDALARHLGISFQVDADDPAITIALS